MNYSTIGKRFLAALIDSLAINAVGSIFAFLFGGYALTIASPVLGAVYYIICEGGAWHATLGKKAMGIMVVDANGVGIDYGQATIRYLCRIVSGLILGIGFLIALFNDQRQTLHDKLANTYVVDGVSAPVSGAGTSGAVGRGIVGVSGEVAGVFFPMLPNGILIGRDPSVCQVVFKNSGGISRLHCIVSYNPQSGMFILSDRNSTYGTFTQSGIRVTPDRSVALKSGERFYLGDPNNMFEVK
ncbi:MAG: RDD family protein [Clostridia bacterium]|nr:RDD family protein [Clostridia bacterium]